MSVGFDNSQGHKESEKHCLRGTYGQANTYIEQADWRSGLVDSNSQHGKYEKEQRAPYWNKQILQ